MRPSPVANVTLLVLDDCILGDADLLGLVGSQSRFDIILQASNVG
jgi:hypothetical protein